MNTATAYDPYLNTLAIRNQPGGSAVGSVIENCQTWCMTT